MSEQFPIFPTSERTKEILRKREEIEKKREATIKANKEAKEAKIEYEALVEDAIKDSWE